MNKIRNNKAFTLIELIVVVGIIGILVGIASPRFTGFTKDADVAAMKADTKVLEDTAMIYHIDNDDGWPSDGVVKENLDPDLEKVLNGADVEGIKVMEDVKSLKNDISQYGIVTTGKRHEGAVVHLQGVEGKDEVTHYNSRLNSESDELEETTPSQNVPGPANQLGNTVDGVKFFGEVPSSELFTGTEIASEAGITQGTAINNDASWLKFEIDGKTLFVAKKPFRYSISWDHINSKGAVNGTKEVAKDGVTYKVRLMTGAKDKEWDRLMYPIHASKENSMGLDNRYTNKDLHTHSDHGSGSYSWMQDKHKEYPILRGSFGVSHSAFGFSSTTDSSDGWRPVLEVSPNPQE